MRLRGRASWAVKVEPLCRYTVVYINPEGLRTFVSRAAARIRGIRVPTTFLCEKMHPWDELRSFHKGMTSQLIQRGPELIDDEIVLKTIWRY
jgi:hypothetical protein